MPPGYFDHLRPPPGQSTSPPPLSVDPGQASSYAAAALRREAEEVAANPNGSRNERLNKAWFKMGQHVGAGSIDAEVVRTALADAGRACGLPEHEIATVLREGPTSALRAGAEVPRHATGTVSELPRVTVLDTDLSGFWDARPALRHLHDFATARRASPWAVLGVALARVVTATPWVVALPPIVGGRASLNLFVGIVGESGAGKGSAEAVAADALQVGYIEVHTTGSGEGIAHGYMKREKGEVVWRDETHAVLFSVSEIDTLGAQGERKGATLMPELRRAWSGERLGFGYADPAKRLPIPAHEYRMCLVTGIQPTRAAWLLDDSDGGTPQRFLWLPANDPHAPDQPPAEPEPIQWDQPRLPQVRNAHGGLYVDVCQTARTTIDRARLARLRGEGEALDGHALLTQLKTASALGLIEGRYSVTDEDWELAGVISRMSARVRENVVRTISTRAVEANYGKAEAEATRAVHVAERLTDAAVKRVCGVVLRRLRQLPDDEWLTIRYVRASVASRDRQYLESSIDRLLEAGQITARGSLAGHGSSGQEYQEKRVK